MTIYTGVNMDDSLIDNEQANNMIRVVYSRRRDLLVANQKALEVIHKRSDPTGLWDRDVTFPAQAILQWMQVEMRIATKCGTVGIMAR